MKLQLVAFAALMAAAWAACPNQCSGHGRCSEDDKCICFRQQGLQSPYKYGYAGADCSLRTCPLGKAYDQIATSNAGLTPTAFRPSTATGTASNDHLQAYFNPTLQSSAFSALKRDQAFVVEVRSWDATARTGTFAWKWLEDEVYQAEIAFGSNVQTASSFATATTLSKVVSVNGVATTFTSGVAIFFDRTKNGAADFWTTGTEIARGDIYTFTLTYNDGNSFDAGNSNTAHQEIECSGRGSCDYVSGKCTCQLGFTGEACQRTVCPNACSGHGQCQTEARFAEAGLAANAGYAGYEGNQQYGCKCDAGYRGADCSLVECPSGADILNADGGAEGMDCSGRGSCDYATGNCKCYKGFTGERCENQSTLV